jgi:hypothetical protein
MQSVLRSVLSPSFIATFKEVAKGKSATYQETVQYFNPPVLKNISSSVSKSDKFLKDEKVFLKNK